MSALFGKTKKGKEKAKEEPKNLEVGEVTTETAEENVGAGLPAQAGSSAFSNIGGSGTHRVLKGFYVSEKSSLGMNSNQYIFRVFVDANKSQVRKEVSKLFNVQIKSVKILNMPKKRRDFGKHPGFRTGFKKAIVVLKEGFTIGQAKP